MHPDVAPSINLRAVYKRRLNATAGLIGLAALADLPVLVLLDSRLLLQLLALSMILVAGACIILAHQGAVAVAGWILSSSFLVATVVALPPTQALNSFLMLAYVVPLVVAGLINSYHMVVPIGLSLMGSIGVSFLITGEILPPQAITSVLIIALITGLLWLVLRDLHHALGQTTRLATETQHAYEDVALERALTEQRNKDLEAANESQRRLFETIQDLEIPILTLHRSLLVLPLVGHIDSHRALTITERVLTTIEYKRTNGIIIDISGIAVVDTLVINHLVELVQSVRLMGSQVIISGVSPKVASTMVTLGVNFGSDIVSSGSLEDGIRAMQGFIDRRS